MGIFPDQVSFLFDYNPEIEYFEMDLAQGRWNEKFIKMINGFLYEQRHEGRGWSTDKKEDIPVNPGLSLKFNEIKDESQISRLFAHVDAAYLVAIQEL